MCTLARQTLLLSTLPRHSRGGGNPPAWAPAFAGATRARIFIPWDRPQAFQYSPENHPRHVIPAKLVPAEAGSGNPLRLTGSRASISFQEVSPCSGIPISQRSRL